MAEEILEDANEIFDELDEETKITDSNETVSDETVFEIAKVALWGCDLSGNVA